MEFLLGAAGMSLPPDQTAALLTAWEAQAVQGPLLGGAGRAEPEARPEPGVIQPPTPAGAKASLRSQPGPAHGPLSTASLLSTVPSPSSLTVWDGPGTWVKRKNAKRAPPVAR